MASHPHSATLGGWQCEPATACCAVRPSSSSSKLRRLLCLPACLPARASVSLSCTAQDWAHRSLFLLLFSPSDAPAACGPVGCFGGGICKNDICTCEQPPGQTGECVKLFHFSKNVCLTAGVARPSLHAVGVLAVGCCMHAAHGPCIIAALHQVVSRLKASLSLRKG